MSPTKRLLAAALALTLTGLALADPPSLDSLLTRKPAAASGAVVLVPDTYLRPWDPLTLFFNRDLGPVGGGPEDNPERFVRLSIKQPGAWTWLDARTLQLRPVEPWPALATVKVEVGPDRFELVTLIAKPDGSIPANGQTLTGPIDRITLSFARPVPTSALEKLITIELRELPGVGVSPLRTLSAGDFEVKALDRSSSDDPATYVLRLDKPIPLGVNADLRMRLHAKDEGEPFTVASFSTPPPFRPKSMGCSSTQLPVTSEGVRYAQEQAIRCYQSAMRLVVEFTSPPQAIGPVEARNLLRFEPEVQDLKAILSGSRLELSGNFEPETLYKVRLLPSSLQDRSGRALEMSGASELWLSFAKQGPLFQLSSGEGLMERFGPQHLPLTTRNHERADLRIYRIDAEDRRFWPFSEQPIGTSDDGAPSPLDHMPGPWENSERNTDPWEIQNQLRNLPSPPISTLVKLPESSDNGPVGLDLGPHLDRLSGADKPGTYLVGLRPLDDSSNRQWMRVQVTDLSLTTVEEPSAVVFVLTSLSTGKPVPGATVRIDGVRNNEEGNSSWEVLTQGKTDSKGQLRWAAPGPDPQGLTWTNVRRIVARSGDDVLVLDPNRPPEMFSDNQWNQAWGGWLQWAFEDLQGREPSSSTQVHIFPERPVIRPEEPVHIRGWVREREAGRLSIPSGQGNVVVQAPGGMMYRYPVELSATGGFYVKFEETDPPTGPYRAWYEDEEGQAFGDARFRLDAYRIPTFEVDLHAPNHVPIDAPFDVTMTASYFAGGKLSGQPVLWRVSRYPYAWTPPGQEGYLYSSDGRYSRTTRFDARPAIEEPGRTDTQGSARITLDPSAELDAQPSAYTIEATVVGADEQTVTATKRVLALPAFALGLKVPRYLEKATSIPVQIIAVDPEGALVSGQELTLRLTRRSWHAHLQAADFSEGDARYVSEIVDELVSEQKLTSGKAPLSVNLPIDRAGVWLVEVEGRDRLGRAQVVASDLYAGGEDPVTWERPTVPVFEVSPDAKSYQPGQTANLVLRSPYQQAEALVITETPDGNRYQWVSVRGGKATVSLKIEENWAPRLAVHTVLIRGRAGEASSPSMPDPGKPATLAATTWLPVDPLAHQMTVELQHPEKARPGEKLQVTVRLKDPKGKPLSGEVTLWLVDAAVLSLGKEARLDPVPDYITQVWTRLGLRDTRNSLIGMLPFAEMPGGDGGDDDEGDPLDKATVRKDFRSVPYYEPSVQVGPTGVATVTVQLPDNVTTFKVRAKASSGAQRFGSAGSEVAVRLPVLAQPSLPRFARTGDRFEAVAIGRVVEGSGGAGVAELSAQGVKIEGAARRDLTLDPNAASRIAFMVTAQDPGFTATGEPALDSLSFKLALARKADGAADAFEVQIPLRSDRDPVVEQALYELVKGKNVEIAAVSTRAGTLRRELMLSDDPAAIRVLAGLDRLLKPQEGSTEQRIASTRALLALRQAWGLLGVPEGQKQADAAVKDLLDWLPRVVDDKGLVAYWPGGRGYVSLTAWSMKAVMEARHAGYRVEDGLIDALGRALQRSLRSDWDRFIRGEDYVERTMALSALASSGRYDPAYFAELSRETKWQDTEGVSEVLLAGVLGGQAPKVVLDGISQTLLERVTVRLFNGVEVYAGLKAGRTDRSGLILPSEVRTLAGMIRALAAADQQNPRLDMLYKALISLGQGGGWGSSNADTEAILALADRLQNNKDHGGASITLRGGGLPGTLALEEQSIARALAKDGSAITITAADGLILRADTRYMPAEDGSKAEAKGQGFVVQRELWRIDPKGGAAEKYPLEAAGRTLAWTLGDVMEDRVQVINPEERHHVVITVPLAAGVELLNPDLASSPPEARPSSGPSLTPDYAMLLDDRVQYFYDTLPKGSYTFAFRVRATTVGSFVQPSAQAAMIYQAGVRGQSPGARVTVAARN